MNENMVDRVAVAIAEALGYDQGSLSAARAAIEAMREPTPEMCAAAYDPSADGPASMYRAMILAALSHKEKGE